MRMRSTGLGKTEMVGDITGLQLVGDYLIMHVQTTEPVKWHVRAALTHKDLRSMMKLLLKPSNLRYLLFGFFSKPKTNRPVPQY